MISERPALRYQPRYVPSPENRERYDRRDVSAVLAVADQPVSTFSVDVDTGSYSNVRRLLNDGRMRPGERLSAHGVTLPPEGVNEQNAGAVKL